MNGIKTLIVTLTAVCLLLGACEQPRTSGRNLVLPKGDVVDGKAVFVNLGCVQCHSIANTDMPLDAGAPEPLLVLGGKVNRVKTYGELITSIINPAHVVSPEYVARMKDREAGGEVATPMPTFNDHMTVSELIDLVTFLDSHYELVIPDYVGRGYYGIH